jgi:ribosome-associated protein
MGQNFHSSSRKTRAVRAPVTPRPPEHPPDEEDEPQRPSKSERKRAAHAAQQLGEELIRLRDPELDGLGLPERLLEAVRAARRIRSRAGGARQRQYIGKLMREIDLEPIRAALAARSERDAIETQLFKRAERWRERLIGEGAAALDELARLRPGLDLTEWSRRVGAAQRERGSPRASGTVGAAGRDLFRALRNLLG